MSSEKRRKARVQGGWATSTNKPGKALPTPTAGTCNATVPAWLRTTVDCPAKTKKFVYQKPEEEIRLKTEPKTIDTPGVYDISTGPSGISRIRLFHNFLSPRECVEAFSHMHSELQWRQREEVHHGETYVQPRLTAWFGDVDYSYVYGSVTQEANTKWDPTVSMIREQLLDNTGINFNSVLCNLYRNGRDSVDWHSDDNEPFGINPVIASLSLGDTRIFELKKKTPKGSKEEEYAEVYRIPLASGTLLIMEGCTQEDWLHRIPKEYHDRGPRINLTYRIIV